MSIVIQGRLYYYYRTVIDTLYYFDSINFLFAFICTYFLQFYFDGYFDFYFV